jgi:hypothetical protein
MLVSEGGPEPVPERGRGLGQQIRLLGVCRGVVLLSFLLAGCSKEPGRFVLVANSQNIFMYRLDTKTGEVIGLVARTAVPIGNLVWDKKSGTYRLDAAAFAPPPAAASAPPPVSLGDGRHFDPDALLDSIGVPKAPSPPKPAAPVPQNLDLKDFQPPDQQGRDEKQR